VNTVQNGALGSGKLRSGELRISGYMIRSTKRLGKHRRYPSGYASGHEAYDSGYTVDGHRFAADSFHLVLRYYELHSYTGSYMELLKGVDGLIVEPVDQLHHTHRRIGRFRHEIGSTSLPSDYHEFDGWGPSNHERHTITII
jgi:hypothetical protein